MNCKFQKLQTTPTANTGCSGNISTIKSHETTANDSSTPFSNMPPMLSSPMILARNVSLLMKKAIILQPGSFRASTFTVITGMIGAGALTLSYGIKMAGTLSSLIYLCLICAMSAYSTHALVFCAEQNNCRTFRKMAYKLYNKKTAIFIQINLLLILWGICVSSMTLTKNLLSHAIQQLFHRQWWDTRIILLCTAASLIILPLVLKRRVSALRYSSMFGLIAFSFIVVVVVVFYFGQCSSISTDDDRKCIWSAITDSTAFHSNILNHTYTIAIFTGGFACHPTILPIYFEMQRRSPSRMIRCLWLGFSFTFIMYFSIAYAGYFTFPSSISKNLISSNYHKNRIILAAQILIAIYVLAVIPLFVHAFRKSMAELLLEWIQKTKDGEEFDDESEHVMSPELCEIFQNPQLAYVPQLTPKTKHKFSFPSNTNAINHGYADEDSFSSHSSWESDEEQQLPQISDRFQLPLFWHLFVTLSFLASALLAAVFADNIGTVNSLLASTTVPVTCYVFPAMVAFKTKSASTRMKVITASSAILIVINSVLQIIRQVLEWI